MIPFKMEIFGFKRFEEASVLLDKKLIAFVGPNEAGKSSFFNALLSIEDGKAYEERELTKDLERESDLVIRLDYLLNSTERSKIKEFSGVGIPRFYRLEKFIDGSKDYEIVGEIKRSKKRRVGFKKLIRQILERKRLGAYLKKKKYQSEEYGEISVFESFSNLLKKDWGAETMAEDIFTLLSELEEESNSVKEEISKTDGDALETILEELSFFEENERSEHPKELFLEYLEQLRPEFVEFTDAERQLKGFYPIAEIKQNPISLINLLKIADINSEDIVDSIEKRKTVKRYELQKKGNENLKNRFNSWSQSEVYPSLFIENNSLSIIVEASTGLNELRDRSDGLRQYISMKAFLKKREDIVPPILLIDEAEIHLHYSAQANLVSDFEKQTIANSIYYTTHSAGCLPSDLGTGIRVVEPIYKDGKDTSRSIIRNSIWQNNGGFSPLLLAMGANVIAFTPARKAVIAEGPSDTILLPRILREASKKEYLDFQVAPGIATISIEDVKSFELEAAKEVYLVDGDEGGDKNKIKLLKGGVSEKKIMQLSKRTTIEDFIKSDLLATAIIQEFVNMGYETPNFNLIKLPKKGRIKWFEKNCESLGLGFPEKGRIADSLISNTPSYETIIEQDKVSELKALYSSIIQKLSA